MKNNPINQRYQIKVNRISSENEKLFPYSKYLKNDYSQLRKIAPKNSYLYKLRINPEIIINEYHQTSNNINTNINIKTNPENSNINNTSINNISFSGHQNNFPFNKYYGDYEKDNSIKNVKNNDKSYIKEKGIKNTDYIPKKSNIYQSYLNSENNNSSGIFSPFSNCYSNASREKEYKKRDLNYMKDINYDNLNVDKNRISNLLYKSPFDESRKSPFTNRSSKNYFYSTNDKINIKQRKNISQEMINNSNTAKYKKRKNPSQNMENYRNKKNEEYDSSLDSFRARKMREMNDIVFSPGNPLISILENKLNRMDKNLRTKDNIDNSKDSLNIKLEYYRIKLFKEFLKHFKAFYLSYLKKIFQIFLKNAKNYKKYIHRNDNPKIIYNKKNFLKYNNTKENKSPKKSNIANYNTKENDLMEVIKSSTASNYYKLYNSKKNKNEDTNLRTILNSYSLNKEINNARNDHLNINNAITTSNNKYYLNSAPRIYKNENNLSIRRNQKNNLLFNSNSKSPSFRFGNKTIINNDISFGVEGNEKENELFRDSKELNKKFEQIQRRKKKSHMKNREILIDENMDKNINKSVDIDNIKNSEEYSEFAELRKHIKNLKKNYDSKKNTLNASRNNKNNYLVKLNSYEGNDSKSFENNEISNNKIYNKTYYNYQIKNDNNEPKEKDDNLKKINVNKEERTRMLKNKKGEVKINKNKFLNLNIVNKINNIEIDNSNINTIDEEKILKKVRVNINKKFLPKSNQSPNMIDNNKAVNNYSYRIVNSNSELSNSPYKKDNIYYSKVNNTKKFTSTLIKDIFTKDRRIHINICYYNFPKATNLNKKRYDFLSKSNNSRINIPGEISKRKNNISKLKFKLASIKEEDISNQNSKYYDESGTFGNNNNTYESKKNYIINNQNQNDSLYNKFINTIDNFIKKRFMNKLKYANKSNNNNRGMGGEKNNNKKVYSRKNKILNKKKYANVTNNDINLKVGGKKYIKRNSNNFKYEEEKIEKFRIKLIKYYFNSKK